MLSTHESADPIVNVRRWSKSKKRYITLPQPQVIHAYNKNMGGVDLTDIMLSYCPSSLEEGLSSGLSEFCSTFLIWHWQIHGCKWGQPKSAWESLAKTYLNSERSSYNTGKAWLKEMINLHKINKDRSKKMRRGTGCCDRRMTRDPSMERRTQGADYLPEVTKGIQKRYAMKKCKKKSTVYCIKCNVYLCLVDERNCFRKYHTK